MNVTIEVFSDGIESRNDVRNDRLAVMEMAPSIHDNGTHYVINSRVTFETLETIQKYPDVIEIKESILAARLQGVLPMIVESATMSELLPHRIRHDNIILTEDIHLITRAEDKLQSL